MLRAKHEKGFYGRVSLEESASTFSEPYRHRLTSSGALLGGGAGRYNIYRSSDGWIALAALEPAFEARVKSEFALQDSDYETLQSLFATRTGVEWEAIALRTDIPIAVIESEF
jgi:crotonobetainyl-CoA:carnitine CoA-transferase CaiB-like acyl-CoA transferase